MTDASQYFTRRRVEEMLRDLNALRAEIGLPELQTSDDSREIRVIVSQMRECMRVQTRRICERLDVTNDLLRQLVERK
jgi:hypothetical protein